MKINDVKNSFIQEIRNHNVKDCGYDCMNGRKYVELRNVVFECNDDYIFRDIFKTPPIEPNWYEENYDPILSNKNQLNECTKKLIENPNTRQAVLIISSVDNLQCTMYMHVFLNSLDDNKYELEYSVHMRSNDAIEFATDLSWHKSVYEYIYRVLASYYNVKKKNIIWCVDSLQLYEQYFSDVMKCT